MNVCTLTYSIVQIQYAGVTDFVHLFTVMRDGFEVAVMLVTDKPCCGLSQAVGVYHTHLLYTSNLLDSGINHALLGVGRSISDTDKDPVPSSSSSVKQKNRKRCYRCSCRLELAQREIGLCRCG